MSGEFSGVARSDFPAVPAGLVMTVFASTERSCARADGRFEQNKGTPRREASGGGDKGVRVYVARAGHVPTQARPMM